MQILINISEDAYKATCDGRMLPPDVENAVRGIKDGTPLPTGHDYDIQYTFDLEKIKEIADSLMDYYKAHKMEIKAESEDNK